MLRYSIFSLIALAACSGDKDPGIDTDSPCVGFCPTDDPDSETDDTVSTDDTVETETEETETETEETETETEATDDTVETETDDTVETETDDTVETETDDTPETESDIETDTDTDDPGPTPTPVSALRAGDLIITEFIPDPVECLDAQGEYLELYNTTTNAIAIQGLIIADLASTTTINSPFILAPGEHAVGVLRSGSRCAYTALTPDFEYTNVSQDIPRDRLQLRNGGTVLDAVDYGGWLIEPGYAFQLLPANFSATANDVEASWCYAADPLSATGLDFGTPGYASTSCGAPVDTDTDTDTDTDGGGTETGRETDDPRITDGRLDAAELLAGELIITEVMIDSIECGNDANAQFIEVFNTTDYPIRPATLTLAVGGTTRSIDFFGANNTIQPGGYGVFVRQNSSPCYNFSRHFRFNTDLSATTLSLSNNNGEIDAVDLTGWTVTPGASLQLDPLVSTDDVANNDDEASWCIGDTLIDNNGTDVGTPGRANACVVDDTGFTPRDTSDGLQIDELRPGEVLFTEIQAEPDDCTEGASEYVEVLNNTAFRVYLAGGSLYLDGATIALELDTQVVGADPGIAPGARALIMRRYTTGPRCQPALAPTYMWRTSNLRFGVLRLSNATDIIDSVDATSWVWSAGAALQLRPGVALTGDDVNDDEASWCAADAPIGSSTRDFGTPLAANVCAAGSADTDTDTDSDADTETGEDPRDPSDGLQFSELLSGDLFITEVMFDSVGGCQDSRGDYVEITNTSAVTVYLGGVTLSYNGVGLPITVNGGGADPGIAPGGRALIMRSNQAWCHNLNPTYVRASADVPAGEITLSNARGIIDSVDLTGWTLTAGAAVQVRPGVSLTTESSNDDESAWCPADVAVPNSTAANNFGTPLGATVCAAGSDTDTDPEVRDPSDGLEAWELLPGEVYISEFLHASACPDTRGDYIEVVNTTAFPVYLEDLTFTLNGTALTLEVDSSRGATDPGIAPGERALIMRYTPQTRCFAAVTPTYSWRGYDLVAGTMQLSNAAGVIDAVNSTGWASQEGVAVQLRPTVVVTGAADNDLEASWCPAQVLIPGATQDYGTPLSVNTCDAAGGDTDTDTDPVPTADLVVTDLREGDLIFTELLEQPNCAGGAGEFIELYNTLNESVDLQGLSLFLVNRNLTHVVGSSLIVQGRSYVVLSRSATCYPSTYRLPNNWNLSNSGNELRMFHSGTAAAGDDVELDRVNTASGGFPLLDGQSTQLDSRRFSGVLNDQSDAWCQTPSVSGFIIGEPLDPDYGTPGRANNICVGDTGDSDGTTFESGDTDLDTFVEYDAGEDLVTANPGDLVITEFLVQPLGCASDARGEYFEIYNRSTRSINLLGLVVEDSDGAAVWTLNYRLDPGQYAVGINTRDGINNRCFEVDSQFQYAGDPFDNNGDRLRLRRPDGVVLDVVEFGSWPAIPGRAWQVRPGSTPDATANDTQAGWCPANTLIPGSQNYGSPMDGGVCVPETPVVGATPLANVPVGGLVITEYMANPADCEDVNAEYIEMLNTTGQRINLKGLVMSNRSGPAARFEVVTDVLVEPGAYAVAARVTDAPCYSFTPTFTYGGFLIDNGGDRLNLKVGSVTLDSVDFRGWAAPPVGRSRSMQPTLLTATDNDNRDNWCDGRTLIPGAVSDLGTPGTVNPECPRFTPTPIDTDETDVDTDTETDVETDDTVDTDDYVPVTPGTPAAQLVVGDLVITELMIDPRDCAAPAGQYVELLNTRNDEVNLNGVSIRTNAGTGTISSSLVIGPGRRMVGRFAGATCHGYTADFTYSNAAIAVAGDSVSLRVGATVLDTVNTAAFPSIRGASWNLDAASATAAANDDAALWCASEDRVPGSSFDLGTPGTANIACVSEIETDTGGGETGDTDPDEFEPGVGVETLRKGDLIITEVMVEPRDCDDVRAEYIEIYNRTAQPVDLDGLLIGNGAVSYRINRPDGRLQVPPGGHVVGTRSTNSPCYSIAADFEYAGVVFGGSNTVAYIASDLGIIDLVTYGSFDLRQGRSWTLSPSDYATPTDPTLVDMVGQGPYVGSYPNNRAAAWCEAWTSFSGARGDKGSPGRLNDACVPAGQLPPYPPGFVAPVEQLDGGELVINEIMPWSRDCPDLYGEWFEIVNVSELPILLDGLQIESGAAVRTLASAQVIQPGEILQGGRTGWATCRPNNAPDFTYPALSLGNTGDRLRLRNSHSVLDEVDYNGWTVTQGHSLSLTPDGLDAVENNARAVWCDGAATFPGSTVDRGSPSEVNPVCTPGGGEEEIARALSTLLPGDLIVTELLTRSVECGLNEQYVEVLNRTSDPVNLEGLRVRNTLGFGTVTGSSVVPAGEYGLVSIVVSGSSCLGIVPDGRWTGFAFNQDSNDVYIEYGTVTFDRVNMMAIAWVMPQGASIQLIPGFETPTDNDAPVNWCPAQVPIAGRQTGGTPGFANDCSDYEPHTDDTDPPDTDEGPPGDAVGQRVSRVYGYINSPWAPSGPFFGGIDVLEFSQTINNGTLGPQEFTCAKNYRVQGVADLRTTPRIRGACPNCQFAFDVRRTFVEDLAVVALGHPSQCTDAFDATGGAPNGNLPNMALAYDPTFVVGGELRPVLFYAMGTNDLAVYTYDIHVNANDVSWTRTFELTYYY